MATGRRETSLVESVPDIATQKLEIQAALKQQLKKGDTWFLVDIRWMKQWKKYVGYDSWDQSSVGKDSANPGPVDTSALLKDECLKEHLMDEMDYYLLPESAWNKLTSWYGLSDRSKVISRKVVEYGIHIKHCKVEVYMLEFKLCVDPHLNEVKKKKFSRADTVATLESAMREVFDVSLSTKCRVWHQFMMDSLELLSKLNQTLQDAGLYNGQVIVLEKQNTDGTWPRSSSGVLSTQHQGGQPTDSSDDTSGSTTPATSSGMSSYNSSFTSNQRPSRPGLYGLSKLGNTDTAIQSLDESVPDIATQKVEIQAALKQQLKKGDTWFLVDICWMKRWKKYVGYDSWDQSSVGKDSANPGPVDNSNLFKDERLKEHLMDERDYYLLPESAWNKLASWYGLSEGSKVIPRKVVEYGLYRKHCKVEVYMLEFKLCVHPHLSEVKKKEFSRADTVATLESAMREVFDVSSSTKCRVWHQFMTDSLELLSKPNQTLNDTGLFSGQVIVLEKQNTDGTWARSSSGALSTQHRGGQPTAADSSDDTFGSITPATSGMSSYNSSFIFSLCNKRPSRPPGPFGLSNLGNTGYMNTDTAIQSLVESVPGIATQKVEIQAALKQQLKKGDTWFLVDIRWMKQWKKYVGYGPEDQSSVGKDSANPGPVDNSNLFKDERLKEHLMDELDYYLLPESAWNKLASWYGLSEGSKDIPRKVVEYGLHIKHCRVEVYMLEFKLCVHPHLNEIKKKEFSRADTVATLESAMREVFEVSSSTKCRVWHRYKTNSYELLSKADQTLQDVGILNGQVIVLEKQNTDGTWARSSSGALSTQHRGGRPTNSSGNMFGSTTQSSGGVSSFSSNFLRSSLYNQQPSRPGLCGLSNLGNTGYINTAVQCLSSTVPLTEYFLGTKSYKKHINKDNPLGSGGAIAEAYGALLEEMWSGKVSQTAPSHLKTQVGHFAPSFAGHEQNDVHEFLCFLLDYLHEDLNLVKKKPYVNMTVESKKRDKMDIAEETWFKHLQRNQSVIVRLFHCQLWITLICPNCGHVTTTFDPFMNLSLPLPNETRTIRVSLVSTDSIALIVKYNLKVPKRGNVLDLKKELGSLSGLEPGHLAVVDVYNYRFHRFYTDKNPLSYIMERDDIYCYQLEDSQTDQRKMVHVPVYMRVETKRKNVYELFGLPTLAYVPAECTYRALYTAIVSKMRKYVKLWSEVKGENDEEGVHDGRERDLFRLVVVNGYGSQVIKKLVDDPKTTFPLSGSTCIACDWDTEVKDKCYDEEMTKEYVEHDSCRVNPIAAHRNIHLMDCFKLFTAKETDDDWYCRQCKHSGQASKQIKLWTLPDVLLIKLKRHSWSRYSGRYKLNMLVEYPVTGLNLSEYVHCPGSPEPIYDLFAVSNHNGGVDGGHCFAYAKNKDTEKWYNFDDSRVSEISEDRLVTAAAYVLFYRLRTEGQPVTYNPDCSLSQSFDEEVRLLKAKYQGSGDDEESKRSMN